MSPFKHEKFLIRAKTEKNGKKRKKIVHFATPKSIISDIAALFFYIHQNTILLVENWSKITKI